MRPDLHRKAKDQSQYRLWPVRGIREVADRIWLVSFMHYDLGFFDEADNRVEPVGNNPFAPKLLPMSPE